MARTVPTVELGGGLRAPALGLGTFQLEGRVCERVVGEALSLGYRHIDTAEGYDNEAAIGRAIRGRDRSDLFLASKVWRDHLRPAELRRHCEGSLRRLATDYLDLYLVHWPNSAIPAEQTVEGMRALREEGLIRGWGVSNYTRDHLDDLLRLEAPATNQVELHPYFPQDELEAFCAARGIPLTAYSPLARAHVSEDPVLAGIGEAHGKSAVQVALRWIVQRGHVAIPKAAGRRHLAANLDIFDFELSEREMERVGSRPRRSRLFDFEWSEFDD